MIVQCIFFLAKLSKTQSVPGYRRQSQEPCLMERLSDSSNELTYMFITRLFVWNILIICVFHKPQHGWRLCEQKVSDSINNWTATQLCIKQISARIWYVPRTDGSTKLSLCCVCVCGCVYLFGQPSGWENLIISTAQPSSMVWRRCIHTAWTKRRF